ncbi:hypothetical protein CWE13_00320 [Aliidiomarina shirensis]|uniref:Antitoxin SocA-like Panacea domain-containing protein n=1 Tax=Aliidiomarina shirensis TaxID=1048642 RepID=A0A432WWJ6_9GAMM|nr:Panacea domain-containing protein [Aliidiomarina shirensis]RUO38133.1 hypothetical protein CWE13_00320 [Aliidiomarina shirensis]
MIISNERNKLINAICYFSENVEKLGKTKLCKLLYFLDFRHFRDTGRPVTGLNYYAWPMGPVPAELYNEINNPKEDLAASIEFRETTAYRGKMLTVTKKSDTDTSIFTRRELSMLRELSEKYKTATADEMVEETHLENQPWHQVFEVEGKRQSLIPYELAVRTAEHEMVMSVSKDRQELMEKLSGTRQHIL